MRDLLRGETIISWGDVTAQTWPVNLCHRKSAAFSEPDGDTAETPGAWLAGTAVFNLIYCQIDKTAG